MDFSPIKENMMDDVSIKQEPFEWEAPPETQLDLKNEIKYVGNDDSVSGINVKEEQLEESSPNKLLLDNSPQMVRRSQIMRLNSQHQLRDKSPKYKKPFGSSKRKYNSYMDNHSSDASDKKTFKCEHCSYAAARKSYLQRHLGIHSSNKPFKCEHCSYAKIQQLNLQIHMQNQSGEKFLSCEQCSSGTTVKSHLQSHSLIQSGVKPFKCEYCSYATTRKSSLRTHLRIHSGEKSFKCEHCSYATTQKSNLQRHLIIHSASQRV